MTNRSTTPAVIVVGGGVIGLSLALELARRGARCRVLERGALVQAATVAAGGMLSPQGEAEGRGPFLAFARESLTLYPAFVAALEGGAEATGFRRCGKLLVAYDDRGARSLEHRASWQDDVGLPVRMLTPADTRRVEPALSSEVVAALHLEDDAVVDPRRLGRALASTAVRLGVQADEHRPVRRVLQGSGGRVRGVETDGGEIVEADVVVVAAGAWSGGLDGLPRHLPIRPVRGQMLALGPATRGSTSLVRGLIGAPGAYLIPRQMGAGIGVVVGATQEEVGFRSGTDDGDVARLRAAAERAVPALERFGETERWSGFRPGTPDDLPVLGEDPLVPGLYYATGHFRNGILLAPATATKLAAAILEGRDGELGAFGPERFSGSGSAPA